MSTSRRELLDDFLDFVGEQNDSNARATAARVLNRAIHSLWLKHPWRQFELPTPFQFSTVANQRSYVLPEHFGRVRGGVIRNLTTGGRIAGIELAQIQEAHPEQGSTLEVAGQPELYAIGGTCGVGQLLAAPAALTVVSDDGGDLMTVKVTVEGYDANNRWRRQSVALNGTVAVDVPIQVIPWTFGKAVIAGTDPATDLTTSVGNVTLTAAGTGELQTLLSYEGAIEHQVLTLYPMPSSAQVFAVPFLRAPVKSLYDGDAVPMNWDEAILEEMVIQWRVNTGEMPADSTNALRPKFLDLLSFENANRFGVRPSTRPFTG